MFVSLARATLFLPIYCTVAVAQAGDRITFTDELMPGCEEVGWLVFRVVDDLTSLPVEGAEVFLVKEAETPIAGEFWYTRKGRTDANGVVRIPTADIAKQWHVQVLMHPDYGTCSRSEREDSVWRVGRAFDVPVLVLDWRGLSAPGAEIGFCGHCGHSPDLANAVVGEDGLAVLAGIDPHNHIRDVYVQHPGLGLGYDAIDWYPGGPPTVIHCSWSMPLSGKVVDHLGQPVAGAFVAANDVHRGPWARTAADGTFTILGGRASIGASQVQTVTGQRVFFTSPGSYPVTLTLPDPDGDDPSEGATDVGEWRDPTVATREVRVQFESSGEVLGAAVRVPGCDAIRGVGDTVEVPTEGPFAIAFGPKKYVHGEPAERVYAFDDISDLPPEPIVLQWFLPTRVVGRVVDAAGQPIAAGVRLLVDWQREDAGDFDDCPDGRFELMVADSGLEVLEVRARQDGLRNRLVWLPLPLRGDDVRIDLGDIVLSSEPQLLMTGPDGPMAGEVVFWSRAGFQGGGHSRDWSLDVDGAWQGPDLRAGDCLLVECEGEDGELPWRTVLEGDGPWRLSPPAGQLDLEVETADGQLVAPVVSFLDQQFEIDDRRRLRRLPTGPLRLWIGAPGYRTAVVDAVVTTQPQTITVTLPPR